MYYETMQDARNAFALDSGFDPFLAGGLGKCTIAKLAKHGYIVDAEKAREQREHAEYVRRELYEAATRLTDAHRRAVAQRAEADADLAVMRRIADAVASTGAPVASMELYGDRITGTVRLSYSDGRKPTSHRIA